MYTSHTSTPQPRYSKMNDFRKQNFLAQQNEAKILLIGDSLIANLLLFPNIWKDYFSNYKVLNFGVSGDKTQNCLWRTENLNFPKDVFKDVDDNELIFHLAMNDGAEIPDWLEFDKSLLALHGIWRFEEAETF